MKSKWGHKFTGEEVFLFGTYRLCNVFKLQNQLVSDFLDSIICSWHQSAFIASFISWSTIGDISCPTTSITGVPNGMNAHVWGACSVRHNDIWMLNNSNLNDIIAGAQIGNPIQYRIYGDSAYASLDQSHLRARHNYEILSDREKIENRVMPTLRETIEWDYGDVARYFPFAKVKHMLKMRKMPVADIYLTAIIMRNALNTLKPNNTAIYYSCRPPTLAQLTAQGPNARPHIVPVINIPA